MTATYCKALITKWLRPRGKASFLFQLNHDASILDVGCGNNSPFYIKSVLPHSRYTGLDIGDYNQTLPNVADRYIVTTPERFATEIAQFPNSFDAVICAHNLEHCDDREQTLIAMLESLKPDGKIYLAFPCQKSVGFPKRRGSLNYYDDASHQAQPPDYEKLLEELKARGFSIVFATPHYQPLLLWCWGLLVEPCSAFRKQAFIGTWELYGFESVIWAQKTGRPARIIRTSYTIAFQ